GAAACQEDAVERERRRLSASKSEKAVAREETEETSADRERTVGLLSLFPQARHWGSIRGVATDESEKTQIDKAVKKAGDGLCGSKVGYACKKGLKPEMPNQDDFCILVVDGVSILGIFDGHGPHGHDIANFVQQHLPKSFIQHANFCDEPEKALMAAFPATHQLCVDSQTECRFDTALSGTTATLAMLREGRVYLGHVGDCRAVLARRRGSDLVAEDLTVDHKPTVESERRRVQAVGGVVRRLEGDLPHRVFLAGKMYPGMEEFFERQTAASLRVATNEEGVILAMRCRSTGLSWGMAVSIGSRCPEERVIFYEQYEVTRGRQNVRRWIVITEPGSRYWREPLLCTKVEWQGIVSMLFVRYVALVTNASDASQADCCPDELATSGRDPEGLCTSDPQVSIDARGLEWQVPLANVMLHRILDRARHAVFLLGIAPALGAPAVAREEVDRRRWSYVVVLRRRLLAPIGGVFGVSLAFVWQAAMAWLILVNDRELVVARLVVIVLGHARDANQDPSSCFIVFG
ncbi:unnamed protein product, partial [Prorocentrum cordatum]